MKYYKLTINTGGESEEIVTESKEVLTNKEVFDQLVDEGLVSLLDKDNIENVEEIEQDEFEELSF
jgi:hypothetical protein